MNPIINTAVIIVNWNGRHLLGDCLNSLKKQTYHNFKIILVDNGSTDNSVKFVKNKFKDKKELDIEIIELKENTGFAKGNNIGISKALENKNIQNIILLNNDTKVKKDFVEQLIRCQTQHKGKTSTVRGKASKFKVGALTPKILLITRQDLVDTSRPGLKVSEEVIDAVGARVGLDGRGYSIGHREVDKGQYDTPQEVFGFCGGAILLRREMLEDIEENQKSKVILAKVQSSQNCEGWTFAEYRQFFNDNFFAYYEDADLSCRMRLRGWSTITVPEAVVYHLHSATAGTIKSKTFKAYYLNRNRFFMMVKNFPVGVLWKGLLLVPKSYFSKKKNITDNTDNKEKKIFTKVTVLHNTVANVKNKIKMVGIMLRVGGSLLINLPRLINQRWKIQKKATINNGNFEKWLD